MGFTEVTCGVLLLIGLLSRPAAFLLLINITVAIVTTKIPILLAKGFWPAEAEARTDYAMFMGLLFLLAAGGGARSLDAWLTRRDAAAQGAGGP